MIRSLFLLFISLLVGILSVTGQHYLTENKTWVFGNRSGLDFNTTTPTPLTTGYAGSSGSYESSASVSDRFGRLLFYTDGEKVWSRNHMLMPNGTRLPPAAGSYSMVSSSSQGTVIVPLIDSPGKYYIFSITCWEQKQPVPEYDGRLFYSVVDMQLNNGLGDVDPARKWIPVDSNLAEIMIAVPGNNNNIWLVTHANDTNMFRVWEVTATGVSASPTVSYVGRSGIKLHVARALPTTAYANAWWTFGQMAVAPDRKKIAVAFSRPNYAELYDFDPCTGSLSNTVLIDTIKHATTINYLTHTGIAFSPGGDKLYISGMREDYSTTSDYFLYQFDVSMPTAQAIAASKIQVGAIHSNTKLRLGPNGKIYGRGGTNQYLSDVLNVVHQPDMPAPACQYALNDIILTNQISIGIGSDYVKPFFVSPDTVWSTVLDTTHCQLPDAGLPLSAPGGYYDYVWDDSTTDTIRYVTEPGAYRVIYYDGCQFYVDSFFIKGANLPPFSIGTDTVLCNTESITLSIPVPDVNYMWQDGQQTQDIAVTGSGTYTATIEQDGCTASDTIIVRFSRREAFSNRLYVFCNREPISLSIPANEPAGATILWSNGSTNPILTITDTGNYQLTVTDAHCIYSDSIRVTREVCDCVPAVPSAFSPNGDGKNDIFRIIVFDDCIITEYMLRIYNRWGELVYAGSDPKQGWDGIYKGAIATPGTYMYHITMTGGSKGKEYVLKGDVTLML